MKRKVIQILILLSFVQLAHSQTFPPPGNLIVNGDFESGFAGWAGTYGLLTLNNYPLNPAPLSGITVGVLPDGQAPMTQTVQTTIGTTYQFSIGMRLPDLGGNGVPIFGNSLVDPSTINLYWNGQRIDQIFLQNRNTWNMFTVDVVAQATSSTLTFVDSSTFINGNFVSADSVFVDNASLVAVPEPAAVKILVAFVALVGIRRALLPQGPTQRTSA